MKDITEEQTDAINRLGLTSTTLSVDALIAKFSNRLCFTTWQPNKLIKIEHYTLLNGLEGVAVQYHDDKVVLFEDSGVSKFITPCGDIVIIR